MKRSHYHSGAIGYHGHRAPSSGKAPALKVKGNKIINVDTGMPYLMIGVSQDGAEYSCIKLGVVMGGADTMPMNEETITLLKQQWYVNVSHAHRRPKATCRLITDRWELISPLQCLQTVRIPMNSACLLDLDHGPTQARGSAYLGAIHRYVDKLIEAGITPILDLHWTEATTTATTTTDQVNRVLTPIFFSSPSKAYRPSSMMLCLRRLHSKTTQMSSIRSPFGKRWARPLQDTTMSCLSSSMSPNRPMKSNGPAFNTANVLPAPFHMRLQG